jgi:NTP pyrophosphatase (non-canonical NTP hydrolase)
MSNKSRRQFLKHEIRYYDIVELFDRQKEFQRLVKSGIKSGLTNSKRNLLYRENCLFTIEEIIEGLRFINHKPWKKTSEKDDINKLKDELVDEFRFFINRCILVGMDEKELFSRLGKSFNKTSKRLKNNY